MEKTGQEKVEYMSKLWIDTRLTEEEMKFLWDACSVKHKESFNSELAGNISKSNLILDKDDWFFKNSLEGWSNTMFFKKWSNYYLVHVSKILPAPKFKLNSFWVNYQKQHEFNPPHNHTSTYSFVVFMKIPTHWKDQYALPISANSNSPHASDFAFVWTKEDSKKCVHSWFSLSPEDEGRMLFFPAWLSHLVYPFYECEEERITISGNIILHDPNSWKELEKQEVSIDQYEDKEKILKMLENTVEVTKKELEQMKKEREKEE